MKLIALLMSVLSVASAMMAGGMSGWTKVDKTSGEYQLFKSYQPAVEGYMSTQYSMFEPTHVKQQVVAGMNYEIMYMVNTGDMLQASVYQPLMIPGMNSSPQVNSVKNLGKMTLLDLSNVSVIPVTLIL